METIRVDQKVTLWRKLTFAVPEEMDKDEFIEHLKKDDPECLEQELIDSDDLLDTELVLESEFYKENEDINPTETWKNPFVNTFIGNTLQD